MERLVNIFRKKDFIESDYDRKLKKQTCKELERFSPTLRRKCKDCQWDNGPIFMDTETAKLYKNVNSKITGTEVTYLALKYSYYVDDFSPFKNSEFFEILINIGDKRDKKIIKRIINFTVDDRRNKLKFSEIRNNDTNAYQIEEIILDSDENRFVLEQARLALEQFTPENLDSRH